MIYVYISVDRKRNNPINSLRTHDILYKTKLYSHSDSDSVLNLKYSRQNHGTMRDFRFIRMSLKYNIISLFLKQQYNFKPTNQEYINNH